MLQLSFEYLSSQGLGILIAILLLAFNNDEKTFSRLSKSMHRGVNFLVICFFVFMILDIVRIVRLQ